MQTLHNASSAQVYDAHPQDRVIYTFDSIRAVYDTIAQYDVAPYGDPSCLEASRIDSNEGNTHSYSQALKIIKEGGFWQEGVQAVKDVSLKIDKFYATNTRAYDISFGGSHVSVARFCAGTARHMSRKKAEKREAKKTLKVALHTSGSHTVQPHQFFNRGGAMLSFITWLEHQGYSLEIWVCNHCHQPLKDKRLKKHYRNLAHDMHGPSVAFMAETLIKPLHAKLDARALSFSTCSSSWLRRIIMRLTEQHKKLLVITSNSYGYPSSPSNTPHIASIGGGYDVVIPPVSKHESKTPEMAYKELETMFKSVLTAKAA